MNGKGPQPTPILARDSSIGLATISARYSHLAPGLRYLRNAGRRAGFGQSWAVEFTLQTPVWKMALEIQRRQPKLVGLSFYIWNRQPMLELAELLKKQTPELLLVAGGPEVSFEKHALPHVDYLIAGEGEAKWVELLETLAAGQTPSPAALARWRDFGAQLPPLGPPAYLEEDLEQVAHRLVYVETSRGCPYQCAYCISALEEGVRRYPAGEVRSHLSWLYQKGARHFKFLDRTFNLDRKATLEFLRWLTGFEGASFHFEVVAGLLDQPLLAFLDTVPEGMFQFEVGIQSADPETLSRVDRRQNATRLWANLAHLMAGGRVKLHADLIWGLPGEDLATLRQGFEKLFALRPHELQLGFLKFLPGAPINKLAQAHGYRYLSHPPYEVIAHNDLSAQEVMALKKFEEVFDLFYNKGQLAFTLERLLQLVPAWELFTALARHLEQKGELLKSHSLEGRMALLRDWAAQGRQTALDGGAPQPWISQPELEDRLRLDFLYHRRALRLPPFLQAAPAGKKPPAPQLNRGEEAAVALFFHHITLTPQGCIMEPAPEPVFYAVIHPPRREGYLATPRLEPLPWN